MGINDIGLCTLSAPVAELPLCLRSTRGRLGCTIPLTLNHDAYVRFLAERGLFSRTAEDVLDFIRAHEDKAARGHLSSVYLYRTGTIHVLEPHNRNKTAFYLLARNIGDEYEIAGRALREAKISFQHLTRASGGNMRAHLYPNGIGLSIVVEAPPPTPEQMAAVADCVRAARQRQAADCENNDALPAPDEVFVTEIYVDRKIVLRVTSLSASLQFLQEEAGKTWGVVQASDLQPRWKAVPDFLLP